MATITAPGRLQTSTCANRYAGQQGCRLEGKFTCKDCFLVSYCGPVCQKAHWVDHKRDCKSPLSKSTWQPRWALEHRTPAFVGGSLQVSFGGRKFLWGNMPAFDLVNLGSNEGMYYTGHLKLLFGASGDLRNVVKTVAFLPEDFHGKVFVTLNNRDFTIVARNIIMLLVIFTSQELNETVTSVIHLWYSAFIKDSHIGLLNDRVRPLVEAVCEKIGAKAPGSTLGKTWMFGSRSLRVVLRKEEWLLLPSYLQVPHSWPKSRPQEIRTACTVAEERRDYRERRMLSQSPFHRLCIDKFRRDGILMPFGSPREEFSTPNPTIFEETGGWPMKDSADPFDGWDLGEILQVYHGPAKNDIYGKLHCFLTNTLSRFCGRVSKLETHFELLNVGAESLPDYLKDRTFSRIEVSNVSDAGYIGIAKTLQIFRRLLDSPHDNPHATLVTLFMNAVDETANARQDVESVKAEMTQLMKYLPPSGVPLWNGDPGLMNTSLARPLVRDAENLFDRYMETHRFKEAENHFDVKMKEPHTIIEKWPTRLKLRHGEQGWEDEFKTKHSSDHSGSERYVEWKRID